MNKFKLKIDYILKHYRLPYLLYKYLVSYFFRFIGIFVPIKKNTVLFTAHGRRYNDSPRAIYEYMISNSKFSNFTFYWGLDDTEGISIPGNCKKIKSDTWKYFITALSCEYWISCVNIERGLKFKKRKTKYLNTWHGTPIKEIGNVDKRTNDDFSYIDYFCVAGEYEKNIFKKTFNVLEKNMLFSGLPRNDELYLATTDKCTLIREKLNIPSGKKVLLYAPTWRDSNDNGQSYELAPPIHFDKWKERLSSEYVLLLRTHPYTNKLLNVQFDDFVRDVTNYPSINELLIISDVLISDYSAAIFDYSILEKPIICFGYDVEEYKRNRGFALDPYVELPGGIVKTEEEVIDRILNGNYEEYSEKTKRFKEKYLEFGGNAIKICVDALFG